MNTRMTSYKTDNFRAFCKEVQQALNDVNKQAKSQGIDLEKFDPYYTIACVGKEWVVILNIGELFITGYAPASEADGAIWTKH